MKSTHELGAQAVFLASCVCQCDVPYSSPEKKFRTFNTDTLFSITIRNGIGVFTILEQDPTDDSNQNLNGVHLSSCSDIPSEELIYDDFFEVENGEATACDYPEISQYGVSVYNHLMKALNQLYSTKISNLHLAFAISISKTDTKISKDVRSNIQSLSSMYTCTSHSILESYSLTLTDAFSCIIEENSYYPLLKTVPDGCDIIAQLAIIFSRYEFINNQCVCLNHVNELCPKATLSSILKYKLSMLFFDCRNIDELYVYIKNIISDINENNLLRAASLCPKCYNEYMLFEMKRLKTTQLLQKYSRDYYITREEERKQKKINAMRKSEIMRIKRKSAHGCSSNLSFQEKRMLLPDNSLLLAGKQTFKQPKKTSSSINNFSRTGPIFNKKENKKNFSSSTEGKQTFSSTMPMPTKKMDV